MTWPRVAAWVIAPLAGLAVIAGVEAVILAGDTGARVYVGIQTCVAVASAGLGLLVARRRPRNVVAPLLCWMGLLAALGAFSQTYLPAQSRRPHLLPVLPDLVAVILNVQWVWAYVAVAFLMLFFPDGRLAGRRWRSVVAGLVAVGLAIHVVMTVTPGPYDAPYERVEHPLGDLPEPLSIGLKAVLFPTLIALLIASAVSLWGRYRRGDELRRTQLKWFALASLGLPATLVMSWTGFLLAGTWAFAGVGIDLLFAALPIATAIAILRHDLYDVDRALSAAVTYGVVSAGLIAVFTLASFTIGVLLGQDSVIAAAGVTAVTAVALAPLRSRLQRRVDRRLYPMRRAALEAVEELRVRTYAGQSRPEELEVVLRGALRDPALRVGYLIPGAGGMVDAAGEPVPTDGSVPVQLGGEQIGAVASTGPASRELLREVAGAAALLVEVVRLRLEVSGALREVESSRTRLLHIGYQERRKLERDLHDGAQQRLVSLGMALRLAQRHLDDGSTNVDGLFDTAVAELGTAVAELRHIAHGLRPSSLDDGLGPALAALTSVVPVAVDLDVSGTDDLPDDLATTAYFVASEAVTNAVKHAQADRIDLRVEKVDAELRVRVRDDGHGGAITRPGSGLAGLTDRVAAVGGHLRVHSPPGHGTLVEAVLPCAS